MPFFSFTFLIHLHVFVDICFHFNVTFLSFFLKKQKQIKSTMIQRCKEIKGESLQTGNHFYRHRKFCCDLVLYIYIYK